MPSYLSLADVIALHAIVMGRTEAAPAPLRSESQLKSAVMRPRLAAHYDEADLIRQAVLLAIGISQAQAFLDGNKRTAFAACDVFLRLNGLIFQGDPIEMAKQLEAVASRDDDLPTATAQFEKWLRERVTQGYAA